MPTGRIFNALQTTEDFWRKRITAASVTDHSTARGDVAENAWRGLLGEYLPARYRVSAGFVISADGERSHQIDCIVYDNTYSPTFFSEHGVDYIPVEAVYAVFEIKQEVTKGYIQCAANKAESVRTLRRTSAPYVGDGQERPAKPSFCIIGGLLAGKINGWTHHAKTMACQHCPPNGGMDKAVDIVLTAERGGADFFRERLSVPHAQNLPKEGRVDGGSVKVDSRASSAGNRAGH